MQDEKAVTTLISLLNEVRTSRRQAVLRIEECEHEIKRLRAHIEEADTTIRQTQTALQALMGRLMPVSMNQPIEAADSHEEAKTRTSPRTDIVKPSVKSDVEIKSSRFQELNIPQAALILLRESGGPLHVNELYNRMLEDGFHFGGDNHLISLSVSLNRNRRFRKVGPGTFDLVIRAAGQVA